MVYTLDDMKKNRDRLLLLLDPIKVKKREDFKEYRLITKNVLAERERKNIIKQIIELFASLEFKVSYSLRHTITDDKINPVILKSLTQELHLPLDVEIVKMSIEFLTKLNYLERIRNEKSKI